METFLRKGTWIVLNAALIVTIHEYIFSSSGCKCRRNTTHSAQSVMHFTLNYRRDGNYIRVYIHQSRRQKQWHIYIAAISYSLFQCVTFGFYRMINGNMKQKFQEKQIRWERCISLKKMEWTLFFTYQNIRMYV